MELRGRIITIEDNAHRLVIETAHPLDRTAMSRLVEQGGGVTVTLVPAPTEPIIDPATERLTEVARGAIRPVAKTGKE